MQLYKTESSDELTNAQRNVMGRTHYVDPYTLRFHKSRVLRTAIVDKGLLFCLVESCALDMNGRKRGFRFIIFDLFGTVISRVNLDDCYSSQKAADKGLWAAVNLIDAKAVTMAAIDQAEKYSAQEYADMREMVRSLRDQCDKAA